MTTCECPVESVAQLLGNKWTILILRDLFLGKKYFSELLKQHTDLSNKVLTQKLKLLEEQQLISKKIVDERIIYSLTDKGILTKPVLQSLAQFGESFCDKKTKFDEQIKNL